MIAGTVIDTIPLERRDGTPYEIRLVRPDATNENVAALRYTSDLWKRTTDEFGQRTSDEDVLARGHFASLVAFLAAEGLLHRPEEAQRTIVAVHDDEVAGITLFNVEPPKAELAWVTVAPDFLAGAPVDAQRQVRGIGTNMVCAAARDFESRGVTTVRLSPLDDAAEQFWRNRGFEPVGGGELEVSGAEHVAELANACAREPDDPAEGHVCICGTLEEIRAELNRRLLA